MNVYVRRLWLVSLIVTTGLIGWTAICSLKWPILLDSSIMHYVTWRILEGDVPYRDVADINWPGSYVTHALLRAFGCNDLGARFLDLSILGLTATLVAHSVKDNGRLVMGTVAVAIMALHLSGTVSLALEREQLIGLGVVAGTVALLRGRDLQRPGWALVSGLCLGCATTVKPVGVLFAFSLWWFDLRSGGRHRWLRLGLSVLGYIIPLGAMAVWLFVMGSWPAFLQVNLHDIPLHAQMTADGWIWQLTKLPLFRLGLVAGTFLLIDVLAQHTRRQRLPFAGQAWVVTVLTAAMVWLFQGKNWPYHAYPLVLALAPALAHTVRRVELPQIWKNVGEMFVAFVLLGLGWRAFDYRHLPPFEARLVAEEKQLTEDLSKHCPQGVTSFLTTTRARVHAGLSASCPVAEWSTIT
jgi:hypothetical protein